MSKTKKYLLLFAVSLIGVLSITKPATAAPNPMVINISIPAGSANTTVVLPFSGTLNLTIDWGEGSPITTSTSSPSFTYTTTGNKTIQITGSATNYSSSCAGATGATFITGVTSWGELSSSLTNLSYAFGGNSNLITVPNNLPTGVTSTVGMFCNATSFNGDISNWNVSNVTNMANMFQNASSFNGSLNSWNVSNVTNFSWMFYQASNFNSAINNWNVSSATNMANMFRAATVFNQPIGTWNVSNVTNMSVMFENARAFNQDITSWNVSNATNMEYMFWQAYAFNQPIGRWNVSNVTSMRGMFNMATVFNQPLASWDTSRVTSFEGMFEGNVAFNQDISNWNVTALTNATNMFAANSSFTTTNYDKLLNGWSGQNVKSGVSFKTPSKYSSAASSARESLVNKGWTITDGGLESTNTSTSNSTPGAPAPQLAQTGSLNLFGYGVLAIFLVFIGLRIISTAKHN